MVVLLLVDAFRWDYPSRTTFIQRLAQEGAQGHFIEPFGFVPREAYFGGLTPEETGYTHLFHHDPEHSPFRINAGLQYLSDRQLYSGSSGLRDKIRDAALPLTTPFGARYLSTLNIPLQLLDQFELSERYAPWEKGRNYTSIFDLLDQQGRAWFQCSWPLSTAIQPHDDTSLTRHCIEQINASHEFAYIHLMDLDWCGHLHGPESLEIAQRIKTTDRCVEALYRHCRKVSGGNLTFLLFGDHGMVTITKSIDLWAELQKTGLSLKHDYLCFLDSTMARFWFRHREARERITALLHTLPGGSILSESDCQHHHLAGCPAANAELIFLAHPGIVIQPNFFDFSSQCAIHGMHGYDPECRDNQGVFIEHRTKGNRQGSLPHGIRAWELFPLLLDALQLSHPTPHRAPEVIAPQSAATKSFTLSTEAEPFIREQLSTAAKEIIAEIPQARSIYVTGGFGRGEGTVRRTDTGYTAVNDYDIGIISPVPVTVDTKALGRRLATRLNLDYVDINLTGPFGTHWENSQLNFDIRHGSQVLWGDPDELLQLPEYDAIHIPVTDGFKLIFNRLAGILTTPLEHHGQQLHVPPEKELYFSYQIIKTLIGLGDSLLIAWGAYDVSYAKKKDRLKELLRGHAEFSPADIDRILYGYAAKLTADSIDFTACLAHSQHLPALVTRTLQVICGPIVRQPTSSLSLTDCFRLIEMGYAQSCDPRLDNEAVLAALHFQPSVETLVSYRQRLYQLIALLGFTLLTSGSEQTECWNQLAQLSRLWEETPLPRDFEWNEALSRQRHYLHHWEQFCH